MRLESATACATFSLSRGGRLASLIVHGHEVLLTASDDPDFGWGSFPMVPYAGRVVNGRFSFDGDVFSLPITHPPHAIHGTAWARQWERRGDDHMVADLGPDWPLGGTVEQQVSLGDDAIELTLSVTAGDRAMPAMVGWHPWFRRRLLSEPTSSVELKFHPTKMAERDDAMVPSGRLIDPTPGPWDDCFTGVDLPVTVTWPGVVELSLTSSCSHWVMYDRRDHAVCAEPQSGPPDAFNHSPHVLQPGQSLTETFRIAWRSLAGSDEA